MLTPSWVKKYPLPSHVTQLARAAGATRTLAQAPLNQISNLKVKLHSLTMLQNFIYLITVSN